MIGTQIKTVEQVMKLADARKSVYHTRLKKPQPAAWVQNLPARVLWQIIKAGYLFTYKPKK